MNHTTTTSYRVGPHPFSLHNNAGIDIADVLPSLFPFAATLPADEAALFELRLSDAAGTPIAGSLDADICFDWEDARCIIRPLEGAKHLITITPRNTERTWCMECSDGFRRCTAFLPADADMGKESGTSRYTCPGTENFILNNFLMMLFAFNAARHHTLLMHASVIACGGRGYLFLGKSGTGKSTHTSLWLKHFPNCHLLNDDNPVVHINTADGTATVFGSPWSGKTPCYRNESVPVGAFVRLEQAPQNQIERESTVRAFAALLPSCSCLKQDKEVYAGVVETVTALASLTHVYHLKCLPDREAAEVCRKAVTGETDNNIM